MSLGGSLNRLEMCRTGLSVTIFACIFYNEKMYASVYADWTQNIHQGTKTNLLSHTDNKNTETHKHWGVCLCRLTHTKAHAYAHPHFCTCRSVYVYMLWSHYLYIFLHTNMLDSLYSQTACVSKIHRGNVNPLTWKNAYNFEIRNS